MRRRWITLLLPAQSLILLLLTYSLEAAEI
jgi:hypothetical protein